MRIAVDYNDNRIHIDAAKSNQEYYCPYCGETLITKKGEIRQHHFAHTANHICSDSWERNHTYDNSDWHIQWQSLFPVENQEVKVVLGQTHHRADVMIGRTVVEFQHSIMPVKSFDDRNNFYFNLGFKVVWLFDLSDLYESQKITCTKEDEHLQFQWKNPKKAFNSYDVQCGCIDLFFQMKKEDKLSIVRVLDVSAIGFEAFTTTDFLSTEDFLDYLGCSNNQCPPPEREDITLNENYKKFKEKYQVVLNKQQERALQVIDGHTLLLAVPGSGKTTVLINRIGYMILERGIAPEEILAITYSKSAAKEMKERFIKKYGEDIGNRIQFRTINSLSLEIYSEYCKRKGISGRKLEKNIRRYFPGCSEGKFLELHSFIECTKNLMLKGEEIAEEFGPSFSKKFSSYQKALESKNRMDYDDQMGFAEQALSQNKEILEKYRAKFKYICVDEAQDTSKIQHRIIRLLAEKNHLFMVGDEDQSIYGFRGAYPTALLNFRYDYKNPYIVKMERNYRSTSQIVELAQRFISQNRGRYEKVMSSERGKGDIVHVESVPSRIAQYQRLVDIAKKSKEEIAILFRNNESSVVLVDLFLLNQIPFQLKEPEANFFNKKRVRRIIDLLKISLNSIDYIYKGPEKKHLPVMKKIKKEKLPPRESIQCIFYDCYDSDNGELELLSALAERFSDRKEFLDHIAELENIYKKGYNSNSEKSVVLSTIHSSKGLEYQHVYMVDVYDGVFPSSPKNVIYRSKDNFNGEQEERRTFYVGMTRAKDKLTFFNIKDRKSSYLEELLPEIHRQESEQKMNQQVEPVIDSFGHRLVKCEHCGIVKPSSEFSSYGGANRENLGICSCCARKMREKQCSIR